MLFVAAGCSASSQPTTSTLNPPTDGGSDASTRDSGANDATFDASMPDTGSTDGGIDSSTPDTGSTDGGIDSSTPDTGSTDGGIDSSTPDAGSTDGGIDSSTPDAGSTDAGSTDDAGTNGHVLYTLTNNHWFRIEAVDGGVPEDLTTKLDVLSPQPPGTTGQIDSCISESYDGQWLVSATARFNCASGACLAVMNRGITTGEKLMTGGAELTASSSRPAITSNGAVVIFSNTGPHSLDLYATSRTTGGWTTPLLLTGSSPHLFHHDPYISSDASKIVFDCGDTSPYQEPGTSICEVHTDGTGFRIVTTPTSYPGGTMQNETHTPSYSPDGSVVFEADWESEQVWRLPVGATVPVLVSPPAFTDDNSPCVFPDGRIASYWLGRPGNPAGLHELKVMNADGSNYFMLVELQDIVDIGMSCGK